MTTVSLYRNKRNPNKYIEVHNDGHYHNTVRQYMFWQYRKHGTLLSETKNFTGDGVLHRWWIKDLRELLTDYEPVPAPHDYSNSAAYIDFEKANIDF